MSPDQSELLESTRNVALSDPRIAEALYRLPNPMDGFGLDTLDKVHPDWLMSNPRVGELVVVAHKGMVLAHTGNPLAIHCGPAERPVSVTIFGGYPELKAWSSTIQLS